MTIHRHELPVMIERGKTTSLTLTLFTDAGVAEAGQSSATLSVFAGGKTILDAVAADSVEPPVYSMAGSVTTDAPLSTEWLLEWKVVEPGPVTVTYHEAAYLVRRELLSTITDTDLLKYHSDLLTDHLGPDDTTFVDKRREAWVHVQKHLINNGRRPDLIIDAWELRELEIFKTLEMVFRDSSQEIGDARYTDLAAEYSQMYRDAWAQVNFRYDDDEDGKVDEDDTQSAASVLWAM